MKKEDPKGYAASAKQEVAGRIQKDRKMCNKQSAFDLQKGESYPVIHHVPTRKRLKGGPQKPSSYDVAFPSCIDDSETGETLPGSVAIFPSVPNSETLPSMPPPTDSSTSHVDQYDVEQAAAASETPLFEAHLVDQNAEAQRVRDATIKEIRSKASKAEIFDDSAERVKRRRLLCFLVFVTFAALGAMAFLAVWGSEKNDKPTREEMIATVIQSQFGNANTLLDEESPQFEALNWMLVNDTTLEYPLDTPESITSFQQRYVMCLLAFSTNLEGWKKQKNWLENVDECTWSGVTCDPSGLLRGLSLRHLNLTGTLPSELGSLRYLKFLYIHGNAIEGTLPAALGDMSSLVAFYAQGNKFSGSVPTEFGKLQALEKLDLSENRLSGVLTNDHGTMIELELLNLGGNELGGEIPGDVWRMHSIEDLRLNDNLFIAKIPASVVGMLELRRLDLQNNMLTGEVPPTLGTLTNLKTVRLTGNSLTGQMPDSVCKLRGEGPEGLRMLEVDCNAAISCSCCTSCDDTAL